MNFANGNLNCSLLTGSDNALYCQLYTSPKVMRKIANPLTQGEAQRAFYKTLNHNTVRPWKKRTWVIRSDSGACAGLMMFERSVSAPCAAEIGIMLLPQANGKGLAAQALAGLVDFGFAELQLTRIEATFDASHLATRKLIRHIGFDVDNTRFEYAGRTCNRGVITVSERQHHCNRHNTIKTTASQKEKVNNCA